MTAPCQKRRFGLQPVTSGLPPTSEMSLRYANCREVPMQSSAKSLSKVGITPRTSNFTVREPSSTARAGDLMGDYPQGATDRFQARTGRSTPRRHRPSATTPCSNSCRSASCISRARESRTTSPTRRSGSVLPFGSSLAHERRFAAFQHHHKRICIAATPPRFNSISRPRAAVVVEGATSISTHTRSHYHARPRTSPQHRWHRFILLAGIHAGGIRLAVFYLMWPAT